MNISVYKEDVIDGLQKAANIIPQRAGAAYLRSLWLRAENGRLEVLATDSNLEFRGSYTAEIRQEGLVGVQGRAFVELLRRLPAGQISLKIDDKAPVLHIEQGRRKYRLATNDASWFQNFSEFPEAGAVIWSGDYFQELLDRIMFCIGDESMDALACLTLKPGGPAEGAESSGSIEAAGMNGHQFALQRFVNEELRAILPENGILLQKKYLAELRKWLGAEEINLNLGDKRLYVRTEDKRECMSLPLSGFSYPDYSPFLARLKAPGVSILNLERLELEDALQRLGIFNSDSNRCTYFDLADKETVLSAVGQELGSATESLDVEYAGGITKIAFPTSNLSAILDHFVSGRLVFTLTAGDGPCGISGPNDPEYLVIIMPMKIIDDANFSEEQV